MCHSLVSRPSPPPVFDLLQYTKTEGEGLMNLTTRSVAHMTSQVLDTKTYYLKLQKQDNFQLKGKSYLQSIPELEAELLKDGSTASIANPKAAAFSLNFVIAVFPTCSTATLRSERKIGLPPQHISVTTCDACATNHSPGLLPLFCILQTIKNWSWGRPGNEAKCAIRHL